MKPTNLLVVILALCFYQSYSQKIPTETQEHLNETRELFMGDKRRSILVTGYIFQEIIRNYQKKISGTIIKDGKVVATSAVVDDKSITINHSFLRKYANVFAPQISVSGTSEDGFVDVFSKGKYSKVITGGFNFNYFPQGTTGNFGVSSKQKLWRSLMAQDKCFQLQDSGRLHVKYRMIIDSLIGIYNSCQYLLCSEVKTKLDISVKADSIDCNLCSIKSIEYFNKMVEELGEIYTDDGVDISNCTEVKSFMDWLGQKRDSISIHLLRKDNLTILDSLQKAASWSRFRLKWFTGSIKTNRTVYPVRDVTIPDDLYTRDEGDNYVSASLAFNVLWINKKSSVNYLFSPTVKFQNNRDFKDDDKINIQKGEPYVIGTDTWSAIKETSFFEAVAPRKKMITLELPFTSYHVEKKIGFDIAIGTEFFKQIDNLYGRFGFFFPIAIDEEKTVTIEPLIKLSDLHKKGSVFFKDQFAFGFNVSVSLPAYLTD